MLKTGGLLLVLLSFTFFGFYKADLLNKRSRKLTEICMGLERLLDLIRGGNTDLEEALKLSFSAKILYCEKGIPVLNKDYLLKEDSEPLEKLLNELGLSDRETEEKRITLYKTILKKQQSVAEERAKALNKLYTSLGFLTGLSICIFLV